LVRSSEVLDSLEVVLVKWLFKEIAPEKGKADTFSRCNSSHTGSGIFFRFSQYAQLPYGKFQLMKAFCDPTPVE
jgi:hypothetical protein